MPDKTRENRELIKVPVMPGDAVFIEYDKDHAPNIKIFNRVIPRGCLS